MVSKLFLSKFPSLAVIHHLIFNLRGMKKKVDCVTFSPDGKYIVSGSDDHIFRLWNNETGEAAFGPFKGHEDQVYSESVAFWPDGKYIASGS